MIIPKFCIENSESIILLNEIQKKAKKRIEEKIKNGIYSFEQVMCPVCNENCFEAIAERDRYGLYMPVSICTNCGIIMTNPRMNQESYNRFYEEDQKYLYVGEDAPTSKYFEKLYNRGRVIYDYLGNVMKKHSIKRVFEVGCSSGGVLKYFKDKGCEVRGCDLNNSYVKYGVEKFGINIVADPLEKVIFDEWIPDLVIYSHTLEHILDPVIHLSCLKKSISKSTLVYIELPGVKNLKNSYNKNFLEYLQNAHVFHYTLTSLKNVMLKTGFNMIYGDEYIRSIFIKGLYANDYHSVISFLKELET